MQRTSHTYFGATLAMIVALSACDTTSEVPTYGDFLVALRAKECELKFRCYGAMDAELRAHSREVDCLSEYPTTVPIEAHEAEAFIAAGLVRYDASNAARCLASFDELCTGGDRAKCDRVLVGLLQLDAACSSDVQCASQWCGGFRDGCGTCQDAIIEDGGRCNIEPGRYCGPYSQCSPTEAVCEPLRYETVQVELDGSCGFTEVASRYCAPDLYCDPDGVCKARLPQGAPCSDAREDSCAFGSVCAYAATAGEARCSPTELVTVEGANCGALENTFGVCDRNLRLSCVENYRLFTETCESFAGDDVGPDRCDFPSDCESGVCGYDGRCYAGDLPNGAECSDDMACASGACRGTIEYAVCVEFPTCN